jgi:arginyl-tRNA synthetase
MSIQEQKQFEQLLEQLRISEEMRKGYCEMYFSQKARLQELSKRNGEPQAIKSFLQEQERKRLEKIKALIPDFSNTAILN